MAKWEDKVLDKMKYVTFAPDSRVMSQRDWAKYQMARELKEHLVGIREKYKADWVDEDPTIQQRGVALYLIDKLALRAGNEKDAEEEADTVGCCSLRFEHIELHQEKKGHKYVIEFDFLGKDSIR